jgi:hypothetical protein
MCSLFIIVLSIIVPMSVGRVSTCAMLFWLSCHVYCADDYGLVPCDNLIIIVRLCILIRGTPPLSCLGFYPVFCVVPFQTHIKHLQSNIKSRIGFLFRNKAFFCHDCFHRRTKASVIRVAHILLVKLKQNNIPQMQVGTGTPQVWSPTRDNKYQLPLIGNHTKSTNIEMHRLEHPLVTPWPTTP